MITRTCDLHNKFHDDTVTYTRMAVIEDSECPLCKALKEIDRLRHVLMDARMYLIENGGTARNDALEFIKEELGENE